LADPRVQVGLYRNADGTNPVVIVNSGQPIIITQTEMDATYYIGYTNTECRTPLREVTVARSETPNINFSENYLVCQRANTNIVIRNPIVNSALQPVKIGNFTTNSSGVILDWNSTGAFLTVSGLSLNKIYTVRYEYTFGSCPPVLGSFVINTNGSPPTPPSPLNLVSCSRNYVLRIPNAPLGYSVFLDRVGSGSSFTSDSNQFLLTLIDPVTSFNYGFYSAECGKGTFQRVNIRLETPYKNLTKLPDLSINIGSRVALSKDANQDRFSYQWSNNFNNEVLTSLNAMVKPDRTTTYYLQINSPDNCTYSDTIQVFVNADFEMPNMFTPNGNGFNESFGVPSIANVQTPYELTIVNKYGQVVFNKSGASVRWNGDLDNGNPAPQDTYYYRIRFSEGFENKSGSVQLVR
jgi:gliding motility-associated-like protein